MKASTLHPPKPKLSVFHRTRVPGSLIGVRRGTNKNPDPENVDALDGFYVVTTLLVFFAFALIVLPFILDLAFGLK